jgi:hypothetical protein
MANVKTELKGTILTVTIDLAKNQGLSASKKSVIVATTSGNTRIAQTKKGDPIMLGVNCYIPHNDSKAVDVDAD